MARLRVGSRVVGVRENTSGSERGEMKGEEWGMCYVRDDVFVRVVPGPRSEIKWQPEESTSGLPSFPIAAAVTPFLDC